MNTEDCTLHIFVKKRKITLGFMSYCHSLPNKHLKMNLTIVNKRLQIAKHTAELTFPYFTCAITFEEEFAMQ